MQYWQGGDGIWNTTEKRWHNQGGDTSVAWAAKHAVFRNEPGGFNGGTIDVQNVQSFEGLQFVNSGFKLTGNGRLDTRSDGSEIRVLANVSTEIVTAITGEGSITKTQGGTLVLSGHNAYEGGTIIAGGVLQVADESNLGAPTGGLHFDGGTLRVTGTKYTSTDRPITLEAGGGGVDIAEAGNVFELDQDIVGSGDLIKRGKGVLKLTGTNAYGNTIVEDGRLIGDDGSLSGIVANTGVVSFMQETNGSFAGDIGGFNGINGMMIKEGTGTLTLEGVSYLDWTIAAGGLVTEGARLAGNVLLDNSTASLSFVDSGNAAYAGQISGSGLFYLNGGGTVFLTGESSDFTGRTVVKAGTLLVGDALGHGVLGGSVDVLSGATLGGSGQLGSGQGSLVSIASGGTLSPGSSTGTLTVNGDLLFAAGSHFTVEVTPGGVESDYVSVTGNASLEGGAVAHIGTNGNYDLRSTYKILTAAGTLSGKFDSVSSDFAFLTSDLLYNYGEGTVELELSRNERHFASVAKTDNQIATATGIETIGFNAGNAVYDAIAKLADDEDLIRASYDALSGEIYTSSQSALIEDSRFIRNIANERVSSAFDTAGASHAPVLAYGPNDKPVLVGAEHDGPVFWNRGFGSWGKSDADGNAARLDRSTGGLLIGTDALVGAWRVGVLAGYSQSHFDVDDRSSTGSSDNYHVGLYGGTQWSNLVFRTGAAYTWHDISSRRSVSLPGLTDKLTGDYNAGTFQAFGELGYGFDPDQNTRLEPFVNLAHVSLHTDSFGEAGGNAALAVKSDSSNVTFTTVGLRAEHALLLGTMDARLRGMVGWRHAFGDKTPKSTQAFSAGQAFTIAGTPIADNSAVIEAGLDLLIAANTTFGLSYTGQISTDTQDHGFKARLEVKF